MSIAAPTFGSAPEAEQEITPTIIISAPTSCTIFGPRPVAWVVTTLPGCVSTDTGVSLRSSAIADGLSGLPQPGHATALSDTWRPHSLHAIRAITYFSTL